MFTNTDIKTSIEQFALSNGTITLRNALQALKPFGLSIHARANDGAMCIDFSCTLVAQRISSTHNIYRASDVIAFATKHCT
ncbi:hypothetical protein GCM10007094_23750 [Pseudovibrio japonicus]|uniref:Uncharacterized protein n=1 Tax=Pseudovibrio japonicus TaxID=366534 RepID=A0ABQ3ED74_9HYPH|nr:hypothetical protein [Pseudovibrio japonicus]GHB34009.1 hypothetical protein GCM10007094_23750 [Pseudovibrio japonicus]